MNTPDHIREYVKRLVDQAPPLSEERLKRVRAIFAAALTPPPATEQERKAA